MRKNSIKWTIIFLGIIVIKFRLTEEERAKNRETTQKHRFCYYLPPPARIRLISSCAFIFCGRIWNWSWHFLFSILGSETGFENDSESENPLPRVGGLSYKFHSREFITSICFIGRRQKMLQRVKYNMGRERKSGYDRRLVPSGQN